MANSALTLSSLDFDSLKQNFKNYLTSNSIFKDYNFNGSNINILLDVMSYNSYLNSFYLNMVASEMFLDSAQKYDSVVSHAKELNYIPRSIKSSQASLNFTVSTTGISGLLTIPKGTIFSGVNSNGTFSFITDQEQTYSSSNTTYTVTGLNVFEGTLITDSFIIDYTNEFQNFILTNDNIDIDSLIITVNENNVNTNFTRVTTLFDLNSTSNVFFLQVAQNGRYEIVFGDGLFGRIPDNLSIIFASYRVTTGADGNGVSNFVCIQDLGPTNGGQATISTITAEASISGAPAEAIESIRFAAPRYFATQQRAVASDDYSSLILNNFGGYIKDINVFGGENAEPKQYGRVIISLKPSSGLIAPDFIKNEITQYLSKFISLPTRVIITDPEYLYCSVAVTLQFEKNSTTKLPNDIQTLVKNTIKTFSSNSLEKFNSDFRYSKFVSAIDSADASIISNDTEIKIVKRITPISNYPTSYTLNFNNPVDVEIYNPSVGYNAYASFGDEPKVTSSSFTYFDGTTNWPLSYIRDDNTGNLVIYTDVNNTFTILNKNAGTVDYATGTIVLNNLTASNYGEYISITIAPLNKDIIMNNEKILLIDVNDITVNVISAIY